MPAMAGQREPTRHTKPGAVIPKLVASRKRLHHDIWDLVMQQVGDRKDLLNLCLVSKDILPLVIPRLYHTIPMGHKQPSHFEWIKSLSNNGNGNFKPYETQWADLKALVARLVRNPGGQQARAVRVLEVSSWSSHEEEEDDLFASLVRTLPKLRLVRLKSSSAFEQLIHAVEAHGNVPELQLLDENGTRVVVGAIRSVTVLRARVNPFYERGGTPNRLMPGLQKLFFACPNLKSFSLGLFGNYGGCVMITLRHPLLRSFRLTGEETFPPLESLSLDGYNMESDEWDHWRDGLDWSKLSSMSFGPETCDPILQYLTLSRVHVGSLRTLSVQSWAEEDMTSYPELEAFLMSFENLEQLTVKGHYLANHAMYNHPGLKKLCLHAIELPREGSGRPTLGAADLSELDIRCPKLEELEIDIHRDGAGWPKHIIEALAARFANLRHLALHAEVGINFEDCARNDSELLMLPKLDEDLAKAFAEPFFALRRRPSRLTSITLKTGESLRRFPQWAPAYSQHEDAASVTVRIQAPAQPGGLLAIDIERTGCDL